MNSTLAAKKPASTTTDLLEQQNRPTMRRVQMWLGDHLIAETFAEPAYAARHEAAMRAMYGGLRITNRPVGADQ